MNNSDKMTVNRSSPEKQIDQEQMRQCLREADDGDGVESPSDFDYLTAIRAVEAIKPKLERIVGRELRVDRGVQDASFFTELDWIQPSDQPPTWHTIFAVRFSAFGRLATVWSVCPEPLQVPPETVEEVVGELLASGFRYVEVSLLDEQYNGLHPLFVGSNWYHRFFDYV